MHRVMPGSKCGCRKDGQLPYPADYQRLCRKLQAAARLNPEAPLLPVYDRNARRTGEGGVFTHPKKGLCHPCLEREDRAWAIRAVDRDFRARIQEFDAAAPGSKIPPQLFVAQLMFLWAPGTQTKPWRMQQALRTCFGIEDLDAHLATIGCPRGNFHSCDWLFQADIPARHFVVPQGAARPCISAHDLQALRQGSALCFRAYDSYQLCAYLAEAFVGNVTELSLQTIS